MQNLELTYQPSPAFAQLAQEKTAIKIWEFLCEGDNIIRAETATLLKKPALEALGPILHSSFDVFNEELVEKSVFDAHKKIAGNMMRQIMEHLGYVIDKTGVQVVNKTIFKTATRYKKAG
jgi:hypothetical protein